MGADVVLHSLTKFLNGHADIVGGMIVSKTEEHYKKLRTMMVNLGCNMDPHQAFLTRRGLKTLALRIDRAQESAMKIALFLESHPKVEWVMYPGLPSHPQHELGKRLMRGPGAMISFGLKGGLDAGRTLMNSVEFCVLAVSLGGIETLIQHPASMTHSKLSAEAKKQGGISDDLVRLSVGIEESEDIIADLEQALAKI
jgi:methionine-gamma-lyase